MIFKTSFQASLENLQIPLTPGKVWTSKKEYMASDADIKKAEEELGIKFGSQTKEFFKKYCGMHFGGGTEYVDTLQQAITYTKSMFEWDDRLKNKKIDRVVVGCDGFGNHLCADSSDKVSWYQHDANPIFDEKSTKSMKLFAYIESEYKESSEKKASTESFNPASMKGDLEDGYVAKIRFTVFGKQVACGVKLECGTGATVGGQTSKLSQFAIDTNMVDQLNIAIPKIDKIIEGAADMILNQCQIFHDSVTETSKRKKLSYADLKKNFESVGIITTYVKQGGSWKAAIGVSLDGRYSTPDVWDEEHGIGLIVIDGKVIDCGPADIIY